VIDVDTSVIVACMSSSDDAHLRVATWLDHLDDDLATTPLIVAEVDHLVGAPGGTRRRRVRWVPILLPVLTSSSGGPGRSPQR
jgi:predicted nucleic acid-binding protein